MLPDIENCVNCKSLLSFCLFVHILWKIGIKCFSCLLLGTHGRNPRSLIFTDQSDGEEAKKIKEACVL